MTGEKVGMCKNEKALNTVHVLTFPWAQQRSQKLYRIENQRSPGI
jgi:hypothetical protein